LLRKAENQPSNSARRAVAIVDAVIDHAKSSTVVKQGFLSMEDGRKAMIGQGHHRALATK